MHDVLIEMVMESVCAWPLSGRFGSALIVIVPLIVGSPGPVRNTLT